MTEMKATLELVRSTMTELLETGERVSSAAVMRKTGGSKATVLRHMAIVQRELGGQISGSSEPELAYLQEFSAPFVREIWQAARRRADMEHTRKMHTLIDLHAGLVDDLESMRQDHERLLERAEAAEGRVESHLGGAEQLAKVVQLMEDLQRSTGAKRAPGRTGAGEQHLTKVDEVLAILQGRLDRPIGKAEIDPLLKARGLTAGEANQARFHAMESGYVGLSLTDKGKKRIRETHATETSGTSTKSSNRNARLE